MTYEVLEQINAMADDIFAEGIEAERIGRVADDTAKKMKAIGSIRMLQPKEHGGFESHPREFAETVMRMASLNPSAGWVHGIVGVHPWQLAFADAATQARAHDIRLHGSLTRLDAPAMLERLSLITGVPLSVDDGLLRVGTPP